MHADKGICVSCTFALVCGYGFDLHGCGRGLHQSIAPTVVLPSVTDVRQDNSSKRHRQRARRTFISTVVSRCMAFCSATNVLSPVHVHEVTRTDGTSAARTSCDALQLCCYAGKLAATRSAKNNVYRLTVLALRAYEVALACHRRTMHTYCTRATLQPQVDVTTPHTIALQPTRGHVGVAVSGPVQPARILVVVRHASCTFPQQRQRTSPSINVSRTRIWTVISSRRSTKLPMLRAAVWPNTAWHASRNEHAP
jgi:hypothetical protein